MPDTINPGTKNLWSRVDFIIEGVEIFTGYSMVSAPKLLDCDGKLDLAVKYSDYPPTEWVHTKVCTYTAHL